MSQEERVKKVIANITKDLTDLAEILLSANENAAAAADHEDLKRKRTKDPNAPKQPPSNFFLFSNSIREQVDKQNPDASFIEKSKIYGAKWQKLTEEQKKPFTEQAKKEREKYLKEVAAYENAHPELAKPKSKKAKRESDKKETIKKEKAPSKKAEAVPVAAAESSSDASSSSDSSSDSSSSSDSDSSSDDSD